MLPRIIIVTLTLMLLLAFVPMLIHPSQAQGSCPTISTTTAFTEVYGTSLTLDGQTAPIGTIVEAVSPRGVVAGCFVVNTAGQYGLLRVYGEDTNVTPNVPGMRVNEPILFRVNGITATASITLTWSDDKNAHEVNLSAVTPTPTPTNTFTATPTAVVTNPTDTPTATAIVTNPTDTPTATAIVTNPTDTPTATPIVTNPTDTPTPTNTSVPKPTVTPEPTNTPQPTSPPEPTAIPLRFVYLPLLIKTSTSLDTPTATPTPTHTATAAPTATPIPFINHDFESGHVGWQEYSLQGWEVITSSRPARSGSWVAWLGGADSEISYIQQAITVPNQVSYLTYWYHISSDDTCGYDFAQVKVNNQVIKKLDLCYNTNTSSWVKQVINLTAFAAQSVTIQWGTNTDDYNGSSFFVDDVAFTAPAMTQLVSTVGITQSLFANFEASSKPIYSLDGGTTWKPVAITPWGSEPIDSIAMAYRGSNLTTPERLLVGSGRYIYRSGDYGQSGWANTALDCASNSVSTQITASPVDSRLLYLILNCGGTRTLYSSIDAGITWQLKGNLSDPLNVMPSPVITSRVYAMQGSGSFWQSDDGGQTWVEKSYLIDNNLLLDPQDANKMYGFKQETSGWVGLFSTNGGQNWSRWTEQPCLTDTIYPQLVAVPGALLMRCEKTVYNTLNNGNTWQKLAGFPGQLLTVDYANPGRILWARDDGLWISRDQGSNWVLKTATYK